MRSGHWGHHRLKDQGNLEAMVALSSKRQEEFTAMENFPKSFPVTVFSPSLAVVAMPC